MLPELRDTLLGLRPPEYSSRDLVFGSLVPRARVLRADLEKCGIPYQDERGVYADFHALRKTFTTYLAANRIDERITSILVRHSDPRLTREVYTDKRQLPIYEQIKDLPRLGQQGNGLRIGLRKSGSEGLNLSQLDAKSLEKVVSQVLDSVLDRRGLSQPDAPRQMVEAGGVELPTWFF